MELGGGPCLVPFSLVLGRLDKWKWGPPTPLPPYSRGDVVGIPAVNWREGNSSPETPLFAFGRTPRRLAEPTVCGGGRRRLEVFAAQWHLCQALSVFKVFCPLVCPEALFFPYVSIVFSFIFVGSPQNPCFFPHFPPWLAFFQRLIPHSFQPSFFSKAGRFPQGFLKVL